MQEEHIDWEAMIKAASNQAKQAARNSERTLGGVAEVLRTQRSQAEALSALRKTQTELQDLLSDRSKEKHNPSVTLPHGTIAIRRRWPIVLLASAVGASVALLVSGIT